jgi:DNA-binding transcriptional MerR regulator
MAEPALLTLSEVSKRTGISMPTLQRYKKEYQRRIPSEGKGRKQRYPESALPVFEEIKKENLAHRGRPRKSGSGKRRGAGGKPASSRKTRRTAAGDRGNLLTLTEIGKRTGISAATLARYVKRYLDQIPHEGTGRSRRYPPEAVEAFNRLRAQSRRGRKTKGRQQGASRRSVPVRMSGGDSQLVKRVAALEKAVAELRRVLERPVKVTLAR